jgi:hypothetical protein
MKRKETAPGEWSEEQAFAHLRDTFDAAAKAFPDIMEPYVLRLDGLTDQNEITNVMRQGMRETIKQRYPLREGTALEPAA